jgi:sugar phosphate isomerase/epimerase
MKLAVVLSTQPTQFQAATFKGDLEANVAHIAELGYDGVELTIRDPRLVDEDALAGLVDRYRLEVPAIGTGQAWGEERLSFTDPAAEVREQAIARVKSHLPFAARVGAVIILGLIRGVPAADIPSAQAREWMMQALRECAEAADTLGVRLALEPLNRYESPLVNTVAEALSIIDEVGADSLGLLPDTFHMNIEEQSIEESIRQAAERMIHFHVADSNRWHPGGGHLDFAAILRLLRELGYTGYVSGEFLPIPDAATAAGASIRHLRGLQDSGGGSAS